MDKVIRIAVDGPSSSGKSTVAKKIAELNNIFFVSTGLYFRTFAFLVKENNLLNSNHEDISKFLESQAFEMKGDSVIYLNEDISLKLKGDDISILASKLSKEMVIRKIFMQKVKELANEISVVMDGRDIGTIVLPDAELKIFLTASSWIRAKRRHKELKEKNIKCNLLGLYFSLSKRDFLDKHRKISPLVRAKDAVKIDTSFSSIDEVVAKIQKLIKGRNLC